VGTGAGAGAGAGAGGIAGLVSPPRGSLCFSPTLGVVAEEGGMDKGRGVLPQDISSHAVPTTDRGLLLLTSVRKLPCVSPPPPAPHRKDPSGR
jgi:hypothetical protein